MAVRACRRRWLAQTRKKQQATHQRRAVMHAFRWREVTKHQDPIKKPVSLLLGVNSDKEAMGQVFGGTEEVRMLMAVLHNARTC